jgi:hypothetical protein
MGQVRRSKGLPSLAVTITQIDDVGAERDTNAWNEER